MNKLGRMRRDRKPTPRKVVRYTGKTAIIKYDKQIFGHDVLLNHIGARVMAAPRGLSDSLLEVNSREGKFICVAMKINKQR